MPDSRIPLTPRDPRHAGFEIYVGWDRALATFFGYVLDDDDEPIIDAHRGPMSFGNSVHEFLNPYTLVDALEPYAVIPADLIETLTVHRSVNQLVSGNTRAPADAVIDPASPETTGNGATSAGL